MNHESKMEVKRTAELLKGFAYLALAIFFVNGVVEFVRAISFEGFLIACWSFVKNLFVMGVFYVALLAASHVLTLLTHIQEGMKKDP